MIDVIGSYLFDNFQPTGKKNNGEKIYQFLFKIISSLCGKVFVHTNCSTRSLTTN